MISFAEPADARAIARVHLQWESGSSQPVAEDVETLTKIWRARIEQNPRAVLLLRRRGRVVGFGWIGPSTDPDKDSARTVNLHALAVADGKGKGEDLLTLWIGVRQWLISQEWSEVTARVEEDSPLWRFYEEVGFTADRATQASETYDASGPRLTVRVCFQLD